MSDYSISCLIMAYAIPAIYSCIHTRTTPQYNTKTESSSHHNDDNFSSD